MSKQTAVAGHTDANTHITGAMKNLGGASLLAPERSSSVAESVIRRLMKPEYLWRPRQVLRRLSFKPCSSIKPLPLPWHCTISACSAEIVGRLIATWGVYDLPLTEAIMRLTVAGDTALDVGANIGYTTLVLALSAGPAGSVLCFEPNPLVLPTLRTNVTDWSSLQIAPIQIATTALSDRDGEGVLGFPDDYVGNQGTASLELNRDGVPVNVRQLDSIEVHDVGIMKVDVEGHEAAVFSGAARLVARKGIRDILFEEHDPFPARSHRILLDHGYRVFRVAGSMFGPLLLPPQAQPRRPFLPPEYPPNYLATVDPSRANARFRVRGWHALSAKLQG